MCPRRKTNHSRPTAFLVVTAIVHDMDSPELFPYKPPQRRKILAAFMAMLYDRARQRRERAA